MNVSKLMKNSEETMSSREISEITGRPHNDLMKSIRKMEEAWKNTTGKNFLLVDYQQVTGNGGTRTNKEYSLTKTESLYVATKFNDEARAKLVLRWQELEMRAQGVPITYTEALRLALKQAEEIEAKDKLISAQEEKIAVQKEELEYQQLAVDLADDFLRSDGGVSISEVAKASGKIGPNNFFKLLREKNYLTYRNMPKQRYLKNGMFEVIHEVDSAGFAKSKVLVTPKGVDICQSIISGYVLEQEDPWDEF